MLCLNKKEKQKIHNTGPSEIRIHVSIAKLSLNYFTLKAKILFKIISIKNNRVA